MASNGNVTPKKGRSACIWVIPLLICIFALFFLCSCCSFLGLSLIGAKGQPSTIIAPKAAGQTSGASIPIPQGLASSATADTINLSWNKVNDTSVDGYKVYRSEKPGQKYTELETVKVSQAIYNDKKVNKGTSYYYVITAVTTGGAQSGNSQEVSGIIETPPLIPKGIYSWADVKIKAQADKEYLRILNKVTGLTIDDVDRLVTKEKQGVNLKKTLLKGTIITNTMEDYRIVPNYVLNRNRDALTDENGRPHVLIVCGNPMKLQEPVTNTAVIIQQVQVFVTTVVMVLPPSITNVIINAGQGANVITVAVLPQSTLINLGPGYSPWPPGALVDPANFGDDLYNPQADIELEKGQQWIEKGKLLVSANPADPDPYQSVTMTVKVFNVKEGITISYTVNGTDGYNRSEQATTDNNGEIHFTIPGGAAGIQDTVQVSVPSEGLQGSVQYTF